MNFSGQWNLFEEKKTRTSIETRVISSDWPLKRQNSGFGNSWKKKYFNTFLTCRWGFTPADEAKRFGHTDVLAVLSTQKCNIWFHCTKIFTALSLENKYIKLLFHDKSFLSHLTLLIFLTYLPFGRLILWTEFINSLVRILSEKLMEPLKIFKAIWFW